ncbi:MAG TPA: exodeoxyribonuclease V subunit gamma, partial [Candidatus Limnocylindria bacterium]|nr:exodeoxyribonuclease V subunit gamma [Candidatus Limnocylindria bacterium]
SDQPELNLSDTPALPARLTLFGISALPPFYLELFAALAVHTEVHCFVLQPCAEWWGDITTGRESERLLRRLGRRAGDAEEVHLEPGHRLLGSLGTLGRDFLKLIYEHTDPLEEQTFAAPEASSLLGQLQRDLLELHDGPVAGEPKHMVAEEDDSVRVHVCHSPVRELEVLRDHLLDWFQRDPTLRPRDVMVMTPDPATYSPLVQAVFDAVEDEARRIPYNLADRGPCQSGQIADTFLRLLQLAHGRLGVTAVLDLLECPAVRTRFGLTEADLPTLRQWVIDTRIHWGRDAVHRAALGQPATDTNAWRTGLRRLLLGYAMAGDGTELFAGTLPFPDVEGSGAELLGHFAEFAERLFGLTEKLEEKHPPTDWWPRLLEVADGFFVSDSETADELAQLRSTLSQLIGNLAAAAVTEPVELAVLLEPLAAALEDDTSGAGFLSGGVTFGALKPMRSIPFRIICLLGMNDGAFPRQPPHLSFDLMAAQPRLGDRSTRDDDRYLFLETLVSARDRLHLSHVGQSQRDNRPIPPSVVISELLDHLDTAFTTGDGAEHFSGDRIVVKHRLHAFSPAYFGSDPASRLFSYSRENCAAAVSGAQREALTPFLTQPLSEPEPERRQITLRQLADFLCHPAKFFLRERLGVSLPYSSETLDDEEPLELDAREAYSQKQDLVGWLLAGRDPNRFGEVLAAEGRLPHGEPGTLAFHEVRGTAESFQARLGNPIFADPVSVKLALGEFQLSGQLTPLSDGGLMHFRCAKIKAKDRLKLWIEHLAWEQWKAAGGLPDGLPDLRVSRLAAEDTAVRFQPVAQPGVVLADLLALYWRGLQEPLLFFPGTAFAFVEAERKGASGNSRSKKSPLEQAQPAWLGSERSPVPGESEDAWIHLCFRHETDPLNEEFQRFARAVFGPLLDHAVEEEA